MQSVRGIARRARKTFLGDIALAARVGGFDARLVADAYRVRRLSRATFDGWVSGNQNRAWEYPWVLGQVRRRGTGCLRVAVDFGAGRSPMPIALRRMGLATTVVDPDSLDTEHTPTGGDWDYTDYSRFGVEMRRAGMEAPLFDTASLGIAISVSVIEHLEAERRRTALRELARQLEPDGLAVLTVDVFPGRSQLWNRVIDEVEPVEEHGTVDDLVAEALECHLRLEARASCPIRGGETDVVGVTFRKVPPPVAS